jgi:predicted nucleic acid-binding protein
LRSGSAALAALLQSEVVYTHDFVIGELACGNLRNRAEVLGLLQSLPRLSAATEDETLFFIEQRHIMGRGIGYIDAHLLAAAVIQNVPIWTKDKRLLAIAEKEGRAFSPGAH